MRETACNLIVERLLPTRENKLLVTSRKGFSPSLVEKISRPAPGFWDVKPAIPGTSTSRKGHSSWSELGDS